MGKAAGTPPKEGDRKTARKRSEGEEGEVQEIAGIQLA